VAAAYDQRQIIEISENENIDGGAMASTAVSSSGARGENQSA